MSITSLTTHHSHIFFNNMKQQFDKPVHVVWQSGNFNFFNSLQWRSIAMLELLHDKCDFIYVDSYFRASMKQEAITKLGAVRFCVSDIMTNEDMTWQQAHDMIASYLDNAMPATLSLFNGNTNATIERELGFWSMYLQCKTNPDKPMTLFLKNPDNALEYVITYLLAEWFAKNKKPVYNFCEDPLQHKLHYIDDLRIKHFYFHKVKDDIYEHPMKLDAEPVKFRFAFSPSQEYWYVFCQHRGINAAQEETHSKTLNFAFAMTDSWLNVKDRMHIIQQMEHFADPEFTEPNKFLFRYRSWRKSAEFKHNTSLIPYDVYMQHICHAKFTLNIPSYDTNCFSLRRFFEAITNDCIPLVLDTCNYQAGFNFNDEMIEFVERNLLVTFDDLHRLDEIVKEKCSVYDKLLEELKQTQWWKAYHNPKLYTNHLKQLYL